MAAESETGAEKSEAPSAKRLTQARSEGQVGKSTDLSQVLGMTAAFIALQYVAPSIWEDLQILTKGSLSFETSSEPFTIDLMRTHFYGLIKLLLPEILLIVLIAAIFGAGSIALQTKFLWSNKLLKPKFSNLNPITGIKRLFGAQNAMNTFKSIAKLCIICPIAYYAFFDLFPGLLQLIDAPLQDIFPYTSYASAYIFWRVMALLLILAILDFIWQKYSTHRQLKMTKEEVKDEKKSVEGDEKTKLQIRSKALQRARDRMMQNVPTADVIVTNPTHYAVALAYHVGEHSAPTVVAKGRGHVAKRIRKMAQEHGVPVLERKPLARALYKAVEVGHTIPYELYAAVAELLAYVYKLKGRNPFGSANKTSTENRAN